MTIIDVLFFLVAMLGIAYLFFWRFRQYRIDKFRQNIFAIRDELFDYAADGHIEFKHPAYTTLRSMMNGYIRFSHRLSIIRLFAHWVVRSVKAKEIPEFQETWNDVTADLDDEIKSKLEMFLLRASAQLFYFIFLSTLIKKILAVPVGLGIMAQYFITKKEHEPVIIGGSDNLNIIEDKSTEFKVVTYRYTEKHSEQLKDSIDHLNADALVYGNRHATVAVA